MGKLGHGAIVACMVLFSVLQSQADQAEVRDLSCASNGYSCMSRADCCSGICNNHVCY